ncbi:phosphoadenosine phosphosulfate reductase domain-containing protein [Thermogladius sp. 4427co]|uniref:phosphoadenosine phosphosulfate reductase domain-containing protein n=1 Tax=Thermogladius sp. 4427co TaxID=3450718 RepID=UPI003F7ABC57
MYSIITRASSDKKTLEHVIETFYRGWGIRLESLGGSRDSSVLTERVGAIISSALYTIYIVNREDFEKGFYPAFNSPRLVVHVVKKSKIRNMRIEEVFSEIEKARARLRLNISVEDGVIKFGWRGKSLVEEPQVYHDIFALRVPGFMSDVVGLPEGWYLALRDLGGRHFIIDRNGVSGYFVIRDYLGVEKYIGRSPETISLEEISRNNYNYIMEIVEAVKNWLGHLGDYDYVFVPWSGGKDSTMALNLALAVYGKSKVIPVFVDIDVDLPLNRYFIRQVSEELGIEPVVKRLDLKPLLLSKGFPTHHDRWCSRLKVSKLEETYTEYCGKGSECVVIVGDRDVESESRSLKPPVFKKGNLTYAYPLKQWSTLLLQSAYEVLGIRKNPLYDTGFYRLGCYICPSLRGWEIEIIERSNELVKNIDISIFKEFLERRRVISSS